MPMNNRYQALGKEKEKSVESSQNPGNNKPVKQD